MAVERFNLSEITDMIRLNLGEETPGQSQIADADPSSGDTLVGIYRVINNYMQSIYVRLGTVMRSLNITPKDGIVRIGMWRSAATALTTTSGSAVAHFPTDYHQWISFYDTDYKRPVYPIDNPRRYLAQIKRFQTKPAGPPEALIIQGYVLNGSTWQRRGLLQPSVPTGYTPAIEMEYYRLPAKMAGSAPTTEYPDISPAFQDLCIIGPTVELMRRDDPALSRFEKKEAELLTSLAYMGVST